MAKIAAIVKNKWFLQGLGVFALFLLIWFGAPLIAVAGNEIFNPVANRLVLILIVFGLWMFHIYWTHHQAKKNNQELAQALGSNDVDAETEVIKARFEEAMQKMAKGKDDKNRYYLYERPWYIIIGPPAAGKTTALVNSGLSLKEESDLGKASLRGIGGTRNCDWWFTDEAVLIDTAGRFTTQDSNQAVDKAAWSKFLGLLKKHRKQRPINGVLVAVSIADLINQTENEQKNIAHIIRHRLEELIEYLGIRFPVYFMFTKCDLIAGFNEFFGQFKKQETKQVWGETFAWREQSSVSEDLNSFAGGYQQLIERLASQMLARVNLEHEGSEAKPEIVGFPAQMASLQQPISDFLTEAFGDAHIHRSIYLRGVYFTSGTQEGTPLDRLIGNLADDFDLKADDRLAPRSTGKSFFLQNLLKQVVIPEAELAGVDYKMLRRSRWMRGLVLAGALACLATIISLWWWSYDSNANNTGLTADLVRQSQKDAYTGKMLGAEFKSILPELNQLREASSLFDDPQLQEMVGLHQGDGLGKQAKTAYLKALENKLLPVIGARLQELLIDLSNLDETELTYEVLKAYLMYAGLNEVEGVETDNELLKAISRADWRETYRGSPQTIEQLQIHHAYLLEHGNLKLKRSREDDQIISYARAQLRRTPLADQVYNSIKQQLLKERSNDLTFNDLAGTMGTDVFTHLQGEPLEQRHIPGLFTKTGFYKNFILQYEVQAKDYLTNNWVLGKHSVNAKAVNEEQLKKEVYRRYYQEYIDTWNGLLKDIKFKQTTDIAQGMDIIDSAANFNGPIQLLIEIVSEQTNLAMPLPDAQATQDMAEMAGQVSGDAQRAISKLGRLGRVASKRGISSDLGEMVTDRFADYHRLTDSNRSESPLTRMMTEVDRFNQYLQDTLIEGFTETPALKAVKDRIEGIGNDRFGNLRRRVNKGVPAYPKQWIDDMRELGWSMMMAKSRQELNRLWADEVTSFYDQAIAGRYPVDTSANANMELRDFSEFFRPKGRLDSFVQAHLLPFINTRSTPWQARVVDGQLNISSQTVAGLYRANQIKDLFFPPNGSQPRINFYMTPRVLDMSALSVKFHLGDQSVTYSHGPRDPAKLIWPLPGANERTRIQFLTEDNRRPATSEDGPWSLFKMLDKAQFDHTEHRSIYHVTFELEGHSAQFALRVDTDFNPLGDRLLQGFVLPNTL